MKKVKYVLISLYFFLGLSLAEAQTGFNYQGVLRGTDGRQISNSTLDLRFRLLADPNEASLFDYEEEHLHLMTNDFGVFTARIGDRDPTAFIEMDFSRPYYVEVSIRLPGQNDYTVLDRTPLASVPLAIHALSAENVDDADADPNNEIQHLAFDEATKQLTISGGNTVRIPTVGADADGDPENELQKLSKQGNRIKLSQGGEVIDEVDDADSDPKNELQQLSRVGNVIQLSNGGEVIDEVDDADDDPQNEIQKLSISGSKIKLSQNGGEIDLPELDSKWESGNANSLYTEENVGIGTNDPEELLHVDGNIRMGAKLIGSGDKRINFIGAPIEFQFGNKTELAVHTSGVTIGSWPGSNYTYITDNKIQGRRSNSVEELILNDLGADVVVGGQMRIRGWQNDEPSLEIESGRNATLQDRGYFMIGQKSGINMIFDYNDIMARRNGQRSTLYLQREGGNLSIIEKGPGFGGVAIGLTSPTHILHVNGVARSLQANWATSSDARVKKEINDLENAMDKIKMFRPVTYRWEESYRPDDRQLHHGFIAQEVEEIMPDWVDQVVEEFGDQTIADFRTLNISELSAILVKAVQEQQTIIEFQQTEMQDLRTQIKSLTETVEALSTTATP